MAQQVNNDNGNNNEQYKKYNKPNSKGHRVWGKSGVDQAKKANAMAQMGPSGPPSIAARMKWKNKVQNDINHPIDVDLKEDEPEEDNEKEVQMMNKCHLVLQVAKWLITKNPNGDWLNFNGAAITQDNIDVILEGLNGATDFDAFQQQLDEFSAFIGHIVIPYGADKTGNSETCDVINGEKQFNKYLIKEWEGISYLYILCLIYFVYYIYTYYI